MQTPALVFFKRWQPEFSMLGAFQYYLTDRNKSPDLETEVIRRLTAEPREIPWPGFVAYAPQSSIVKEELGYFNLNKRADGRPL